MVSILHLTFPAPFDIIGAREAVNRGQPVWRSIPNKFVAWRNAAFRWTLEGGYFFRLSPNLIAAITSISNAMVSVILIGLTSFYSLEGWPRSLLLSHTIMYMS